MSCSNCWIVTPSAPADPPFLFDLQPRIPQQLLGMTYDFPSYLDSDMCFLPYG